MRDASGDESNSVSRSRKSEGQHLLGEEGERQKAGKQQSAYHQPEAGENGRVSGDKDTGESSGDWAATTQEPQEEGAALVPRTYKITGTRENLAAASNWPLQFLVRR